MTHDIKNKSVVCFNIVGIVSRTDMSGGGSKVSKFMMPTQPRKVNCTETSSSLLSTVNALTELRQDEHQASVYKQELLFSE
jgi:hypothetical protein